MGSIRRTHRQLLRCVGTSRGLSFASEASSPSSSPSVRAVKLQEAVGFNGSPVDVSQTPLLSATSAKVETPESQSLFWQEIFSSLSMLVPSLYAYLVCDVAAAQHGAFRPGVYALVYSTYAHCIVSMYYHAHNALHDMEPGFDAYLSPYRIADLVAIHLCCVTFGWAVSHGAMLFTAFSLVLNVGFSNRLITMFRKRESGDQGDGLRIGVSILVYTTPMLLRGDAENYLGAMAFFALAGVAWGASPRFNGWTHGIFHLLLAPYFHFLLRSAAGVTGAASFLL